MTDPANEGSAAPLRTGVDGLDDVLAGGFPRGGLHLVEGLPGSGKTTLALQFLLAGVAEGESCLFVTLAESQRELTMASASHGWSLDGISILEVIASEESLRPEAHYTMYHPSEVELAETTKLVLAEAERLQPDRLVIDSLSELRLLAESPLRYRRQMLALKQFFARLGSTVLLIEDRLGEGVDMPIHSLVQSVISLERDIHPYGTLRRRLQVSKVRGRMFREGYHDFAIRPDGVQVYPRLVAAEHRATSDGQDVLSGIPTLDALLGGGLTPGTSTLIIGAAGTGKSSIATQYVTASASRNERSLFILFDESIRTLKMRSSCLGHDLDAMVESGLVELQQVDPAERSPGEFSDLIRRAVTERATRFVVIDSLNGLLNAMPNEQFLSLHLHELLTYLGHQGVTTLLTLTQHGIIGADTSLPVDASYLADTVVLLRYFETAGEVRQAISVIKKRTGAHERTIRELRIGKGLEVGEPLRDFRHVLSGSPERTRGRARTALNDA
jgi:circadian clock protein KaiC